MLLIAHEIHSGMFTIERSEHAMLNVGQVRASDPHTLYRVCPRICSFRCLKIVLLSKPIFSVWNYVHSNRSLPWIIVLFKFVVSFKCIFLQQDIQLWWSKIWLTLSMRDTQRNVMLLKKMTVSAVFSLVMIVSVTSRVRSPGMYVRSIEFYNWHLVFMFQFRNTQFKIIVLRLSCFNICQKKATMTNDGSSWYKVVPHGCCWRVAQYWFLMHWLKVVFFVVSNVR